MRILLIISIFIFYYQNIYTVDIINLTNFNYVTSIAGDDHYILVGTKNGLIVMNRWDEKIVRLPHSFADKSIYTFVI